MSTRNHVLFRENFVTPLPSLPPSLPPSRPPYQEGPHPLPLHGACLQPHHCSCCFCCRAISDQHRAKFLSKGGRGDGGGRGGGREGGRGATAGVDAQGHDAPVCLQTRHSPKNKEIRNKK